MKKMLLALLLLPVMAHAESIGPLSSLPMNNQGRAAVPVDGTGNTMNGLQVVCPTCNTAANQATANTALAAISTNAATSALQAAGTSFNISYPAQTIPVVAPGQVLRYSIGYFGLTASASNVSTTGRTAMPNLMGAKGVLVNVVMSVTATGASITMSAGTLFSDNSTTLANMNLGSASSNGAGSTLYAFYSTPSYMNLCAFGIGNNTGASGNANGFNNSTADVMWTPYWTFGATASLLTWKYVIFDCYVYY